MQIQITAIRDERVPRTTREDSYGVIEDVLWAYSLLAARLLAAYLSLCWGLPTGVVEYAKATPEDILLRVTVHNRGPEAAKLNLLPTIWFRNTGSWNPAGKLPRLSKDGNAGGGRRSSGFLTRPGNQPIENGPAKDAS